jgi:hypothetical protein
VTTVAPGAIKPGVVDLVVVGPVGVERGAAGFMSEERW